MCFPYTLELPAFPRPTSLQSYFALQRPLSLSLSFSLVLCDCNPPRDKPNPPFLLPCAVTTHDQTTLTGWRLQRVPCTNNSATCAACSILALCRWMWPKYSCVATTGLARPPSSTHLLHSDTSKHTSSHQMSQTGQTRERLVSRSASSISLTAKTVVATTQAAAAAVAALRQQHKQQHKQQYKQHKHKHKQHKHKRKQQQQPCCVCLTLADSPPST